MDVLRTRDFDGQRLKRPGTWVVGFVADWCPWSAAFRPEFEALARPGPASYAYGDVTDTDDPLWDAFEIEVVPTIVVFRDGEPTFRRDGRPSEGLSEAELREVREAAESGEPGRAH